MIGERRARVEDERLVRGQGCYLADLRRPRMLEAAFVRSPHPAARVGKIDASAAGAIVLTAADLPHTPLVDAVAVEGLRKTPQPALADGRVRFVGEPVAIALAETRALAEDAAERVRVAWEPEPWVADTEQRAPLIHGHVPDNRLFEQRKRYGDPDAAFASADLVVEVSLDGNRYTAAPLEGRGCLAEADADRLTVWASTQGPHLLRRRLAQTTGLAEQRIRVIAPDVGGAFGLKIPAAPEEIAVALAARAVGRPVRWVEDRRENLVAAPHAKDQRIALELALAGDGGFLGVRATVVGDAGAYSFNSASALIEPYLAAGLLPGPYAIEHVDVRIVAALTNKSPVCPYRGVGWTQPHTARELAIERAARRLGVAASELRRRNLVRTFPHRTATGMLYDSGSYVASLDSALELLGPVPRSAGGDVRTGVAVTTYVEPTGWGSEGALQSEWSFASHDAVRVQVDPSGGVIAAVGTPSQGQGHATTLAQVVAEELGVSVGEVAIVAGDTDGAPVSTSGTRASRVAVVTGGALALACRRLRERLLDVAAALLERDDASGLTLADGVVRGGARELTLRELAEAAHFDPALRSRVPEPELAVVQFYDPRAQYGNGAIAAVVDVDLGTGGVTVRRLAVVEDCGTMLNPTVVEGQLSGAIAQGIGGALLEEVAYGSDGRPTADSLATYLLPRIGDIPELAIGHHESPSPFTVNGVKGMGESGAIAAPAAIAAAVEDALAGEGFEVTRLPLGPETVLGGLGWLEAGLGAESEAPSFVEVEVCSDSHREPRPRDPSERERASDEWAS